MALLEVKNLEAFYAKAKVLHGINFAINKGEVISILGPNGAGKSTILRAICRMVHTKGEIYFKGNCISNMSTTDIARMGIAYVTEGHDTFVELSVEENLSVGAITRTDKAEVAKDLTRIYSYFPVLKEKRKQQAGSLSGGEQQMLAISRALMLGPTLMLLDEPSFSLAPLIVQQIFDIIDIINREHQVTILLVEQNANLAFKLAKYVYLLESGQIAMQGESSEIKKNESIRRTYLGY